jgi:hypothetical protein
MTITINDQWTSADGWVYPSMPDGKGSQRWRWRVARSSDTVASYDADHRWCLQWYDDATGQWTLDGYYRVETIYTRVYEIPVEVRR